MRMGYYWPRMELDSFEYAKRCKKCQMHGNFIHAPTQELHPITTICPFSQWGFDLIGEIHPSSSNGHWFIITATEYFTKWVEAIPFIHATGKQVAMFLLNYIICRYGIPMSIVTDNGKQFKNHEMKKLCENFILFTILLQYIILKVMVKLKPLIKLLLKS